MRSDGFSYRKTEYLRPGDCVETCYGLLTVESVTVSDLGSDCVIRFQESGLTITTGKLVEMNVRDSWLN